MLDDINFIAVSEDIWNKHIETFPKLKHIPLNECIEIKYFFDIYGKVYASITNDTEFAIREEMFDPEIV